MKRARGRLDNVPAVHYTSRSGKIMRRLPTNYFKSLSRDDVEAMREAKLVEFKKEEDLRAAQIMDDELLAMEFAEMERKTEEAVDEMNKALKEAEAAVREHKGRVSGVMLEIALILSTFSIADWCKARAGAQD